MRREEVFLATKLPKSRLATLGQGEETIHALHTKPHERNAKGFLELCFVPFRVERVDHLCLCPNLVWFDLERVSKTS